MEQIPSKLVKGRKILLFGLRHVQLHYCLTTWEKEKLCKELAQDRVSFTRWPTWDWSISPLHREFITVSKALSKEEWWKLVSRVNYTACLAANKFKVRTDGGLWIFSKSAAITSPSELWMTTPRLASSDSSNIDIYWD